MTSGNEFSQSKTSNGNQAFFQKNPSRPAPSLASARAPRPRYDQQGKIQGFYSQDSVAKGSTTYLFL